MTSKEDDAELAVTMNKGEEWVFTTSNFYTIDCKCLKKIEHKRRQQHFIRFYKRGHIASWRNETTKQVKCAFRASPVLLTQIKTPFLSEAKGDSTYRSDVRSRRSRKLSSWHQPRKFYLHHCYGRNNFSVTPRRDSKGLSDLSSKISFPKISLWRISLLRLLIVLQRTYSRLMWRQHIIIIQSVLRSYHSNRTVSSLKK